MRKSLLSKSLYLDTLKRLILPTIVYTAVVMAVSIISIVSIAAEAEVANLFTLMQMSPLLTVVATVFAPVLTLLGYSHLTKRASADFYDSLPVTRIQTVNSISLAAITSAVITVVVSSVASIVTCLILSEKCVIAWGTSITALFAVILTAVFAVVVFTLSSAITGTTVSAAMVGFLIAAGPRIIMSLINSAVAEYAPMLVQGKIIPLFDNNYNLYTLLAMPGNSTNIRVSAFVYTAILTIIYATAAAFLYKARKSETASSHAPNAILRHSYGIMMATLVGSLGVYSAFSWGFDITVVVAIFFAVAIHYSYELFTLKRAKAFLSATVTLPVLFLAIGAVATVTAISAKVATSYSPDSEDIKYVAIAPDTAFGYVEFDEYVALTSGEVQISDDKAREIISGSVRENIKSFEDGSYYRKYTGVGSEYTSVTVKLKSGIRGRYRHLYVSNEDYAYLMDVLGKSDWYKSLWTELPESPNRITVSYDSLVFDSESSDEIYKTLAEEIAEIGYDKWISIYKNYNDGPRVTFNVDLNGVPTEVYIDVPEELTKTITMLKSRMGVAMQKQLDNVYEVLEMTESESENIYIYMYVTTDEYSGSMDGYANELFALGDKEELLSFIKSVLTDEYVPYSSDEPCVDLDVSCYSDGHYYSSVRCKLSQNVDVQLLKSLMEKYGAYID